MQEIRKVKHILTSLEFKLRTDSSSFLFFSSSFYPYSPQPGKSSLQVFENGTIIKQRDGVNWV